MPSVEYIEGVLLQGYTQAGAVTWEGQSIITQGFWGATVPVSSISVLLSEVLISSAITSLGDYFPRWMNVHYDTHPTTGSILRRFLVSPLEEILLLDFYKKKVFKTFIKNHWLGEASRGWYIGTNLLSEEVKTVVIQTSVAIIYPRRCSSEWEFINTIGPVYIVDKNKKIIYFKGLDNNVISTYSNGEAHLPGGDLVKGEDIYLKSDSGIWEIIEAGMVRDDAFSTPSTGNVYIVYPSNLLNSSLGGGIVYINGGPGNPLSKMDYWNNLDELGLLFDLPRFDSEDNESYWARLESLFTFLGSTTEDGIKKSVGRKLGLISTFSWDGISTIPINNTSGLWLNIPHKNYVSEEPMLQVGNLYTTSKRNIGLSYAFSGAQKINIPASGRVVGEFSKELLGDYKYIAYSITKNQTGGVTQLAKNENTEEGVYRAMVCSGLGVNTLNKSKYKKERLIRAGGEPTNLLVEIADLIRRKVDITFGHVMWEKSYWFSEVEVSPSLDYIPIAMD